MRNHTIVDLDSVSQRTSYVNMAMEFARERKVSLLRNVKIENRVPTTPSKLKDVESAHQATPCNTLQHPATHCNTLQHTATHCNTLQHTATHCNTLQHTNPRTLNPCTSMCVFVL